MKIIRINDRDNVAIALEDLNAAETVSAGPVSVTLQENVGRGHKIALKNFGAGENVIKYGYPIGRTTAAVVRGALLHAHNLASNLNDIIEYKYEPAYTAPAATQAEALTFQGYRRKNGRTGIRNEIWIINSVSCVNTSAQRIAELANSSLRRENFDGVFTFQHQFGCSQLGDDLINTRRILAGLMRNPNAGGILLLGLGCENNQLKHMLEDTSGIDHERLRYFNAQDVEDEIEEGLKAVEQLFEIMKDDRRETVPLSELVIAMKCGGSDGFSGITANPLTGRITDRVTASGGTVVISEVPEMFGAEQILMNRAKDDNVFKGIVRLINSFKQYFMRFDQPVYENPSPGNKAGGITTLEEKSLGAIQKGGNAVITEVLEYGRTAEEKGLVLINAPGNDGVSSTAMTAAGAVIILFTTGRGTPLGFPVPTVKISTNTPLFMKKRSWMDFDAGEILNGDKSWEKLTDELMTFVIGVASGEIKTRNEINGYKEIAIWKEGVTL